MLKIIASGSKTDGESPEIIDKDDIVVQEVETLNKRMATEYCIR